MLDWLAGHGILPLALGTTRDGHPRHPLYVPYTAELVPFIRFTTKAQRAQREDKQ